jgi:hypothetical protein
MDKLPHPEHAQIDREKVVGYLLDARRSGGKAMFFQRMGFAAAEWDELADALRRHGSTHPVTSTVESQWGIRYSVDGPLETPSGRTPLVRTAWIIEMGKDVPRLITAHPISVPRS